MIRVRRFKCIIKHWCVNYAPLATHVKSRTHFHIIYCQLRLASKVRQAAAVIVIYDDAKASVRNIERQLMYHFRTDSLLVKAMKLELLLTKVV